MHEDYADIREKIHEAPQWFDENAVPRYCAFEPGRCANIYADEAVLAEISCQACGQLFQVAFTGRRKRTLAAEIEARTLHYGDPPNIRCCPSGSTMNSEMRGVLEYWSRADPQFVGDEGRITNIVGYMEWRRNCDLEIAIDPDVREGTA